MLEVQRQRQPTALGPTCCCCRPDCAAPYTYAPTLSMTNGLMDFAGSGVVHMTGGGAGATRHCRCAPPRHCPPALPLAAAPRHCPHPPSTPPSPDTSR